MGEGEKVSLGKVCDVRDGTHNSPKYVKNGYPLITSKNITNGRIDFDNVSLISQDDYNQINKRSFVDDGDILMPMIGTIGNPVIVNKKREFAIKNVALIKFKNAEISNKYVNYCLKSNLFINYIDKENRGGTQKFLSLDNIRKFCIPLPSFDVQKYIADTLDKTQEIIDGHKKQLEELDNLIKATFYEMFGDPSFNDREWVVSTVEKACKNILGGGTPSKSKPEYYIGHIPWVTPKDMKNNLILDSLDHINEEAVSNSSVKLIPTNSILMVIRSGILKKSLPVAINQVEVTINQDMKALIVNDTVKPEYLLYYFIMTQNSILKNVRSVTADNIEFGIIKDASLPLPPLELQNKFAEIVTNIEEQKTLVKQSTTESENLFSSLMSEYFD
jgi:type I restriction enzyme S subunit